MRDALLDRSALVALLRDGVGALLSADARLIAESERSKIGDSLDLDAASRDEYPNHHRWDYVLSVSSTGKLIGLEPHSGKDSEISVVIAKKQHAVTYLRAHLRQGHHVTQWYWVSHGAVTFSRMDAARRRLDQAGITFVGRSLIAL